MNPNLAFVCGVVLGVAVTVLMLALLGNSRD